MSSEWTPARRSALRALCDTIVPSLQVSPDPERYWARAASELEIDTVVAQLIDTSAPPAIRAGLLGLIDAFGQYGLEAATPEGREGLVHAFIASSPDVALGVVALQRMIVALYYGWPDAQGRNPTWPVIGYPGPRRAPTPVPKPIALHEVTRDGERLDADVCIVGSGAGGGVIAGELAAKGLRVVVLEAGGYFNESDFNQLELWSLQNLYWRGGYTPTTEGTLHLLAGATLGGGTQVNWENCVATPDYVRSEWARTHGIDGVDGAEFDACLERVRARLSVNDRCSDLNGPHQRLEAAARKLGYHFGRTQRNVDPARYDAETAGFHGFGDITGSRQSTVNTYLQDAQQRDTQIVVRAKAQRIVTEAGRAQGVEASVTGADGVTRKLIVRAPKVVAACGALETPALLLRSGIGGPAAGNFLRLHPCSAMGGIYADDQRAWWGPPQSGLCEQFMRVSEDHGYLIEGAHHGVAVYASSYPWLSGEDHKRWMLTWSRAAVFISITRDRGHGRVSIDEHGESVVSYRIDDALDRAHLRAGTCELARMHEAAGAEQLTVVANGQIESWQRGEDLAAFERAAIGPDGTPFPQVVFSAHQMGSARMGTDPETSVAAPSGELHDTRGVFIGDTSAFPSAPGVNPMLTCMALATRTAARIAR